MRRSGTRARLQGAAPPAALVVLATLTLAVRTSPAEVPVAQASDEARSNASSPSGYPAGGSYLIILEKN